MNYLVKKTRMRKCCVFRSNKHYHAPYGRQIYFKIALKPHGDKWFWKSAYVNDMQIRLKKTKCKYH